MWRLQKPTRTIGLSALMLVAAGCTISIQPWTKPTPPPPPPIDAPPGHPVAPTGFNPPAPRQLPSSMNSSNEGTSNLIRQLNDLEDQRKVLLDQVQTLRRDVKDREEKLRQASYEIDESSKHVKRTRDDFRQWQTEMDDLRERVRKLEDYRAALKPLIEETLHYLNREKEAPGLFSVPTPSK